MASRLDEQVIFGLLYLWLRDADLPLTPRTVRYLARHLSVILSDEPCFSSDEIAAFIEVNHFVQHVVRRLRQLRPRLTRRERNAIYHRPRPRAQLAPLDKSE